jgi:hypothetical protein
LDAVIQQGQQVVRYDAFQGFSVDITEFHPKTIEFGTAQEGLALGLEIVIEITDKIDRSNPGKRDLLVFTVRSEQIDGIDLTKARRVEITSQGFLVDELHNDLLVRRGWGTIFQISVVPELGWREFANPQNVCYVKHVFLSTYCFH